MLCETRNVKSESWYYVKRETADGKCEILTFIILPLTKRYENYC